MTKVVKAVIEATKAALPRSMNSPFKQSTPFATRSATGLGGSRVNALHLTSTRGMASVPPSQNPKKLTIQESNKPIPTTETTNADQESLKVRLIEGIKAGELPDEIFEMSEEAFIKLAGATINSTAALPLMVPLLRLMIGARNDQPYSVSIKKLGRVRLDQLVTDARLMLARRVIASIMPAIFTQMTGLTGFDAMSLNASIETFISGFPKSQKSEPYQRFRAIHGSTFGFIKPSENLVTLTEAQYKNALEEASDKNNPNHYHYRVIDESKCFSFIDDARIKPKINLATITEQQYEEAVESAKALGIEVDKDASYTALRLSYKRLQVLQTNFTDNIVFQSILLAGRNTFFSAGVFAAKTGAASFVASASETLKGIGLEDEGTAIQLASLAIRIGCAIATAPIDNALTKASSGEISFAEFRAMKLSEQFSFRGAAARTAFVLCAFFTIVYGSETGEFVKDKIVESPLYNKTVAMLTELFAKHQDSQIVDKPEDKDLLSDLMKLAASEENDSANKDKSMALLKFLLGDVSSDQPVSELRNAKNFLEKVVKYMEENPGALAGIGKADSDIILRRNPSTNPSEPKVSAKENQHTK